MQEKTSKKVATIAGQKSALLAKFKDTDVLIAARCIKARRGAEPELEGVCFFHGYVGTVGEFQVVMSSALTQAPNKPKTRRK